MPLSLPRLRPRETAQPTAPDFFIVGWQKSGTHWLTAILNAHPEIRCFPSLPKQVGGDGSPPAHFFDVLARMERDYPSFRKSMARQLEGHFAPVLPEAAPRTDRARRKLRETLRDAFVAYLEHQRELHDKPIVGEKTAETIHHLDLVDELFPGVKKVAIMRDPRDRTVSYHFQEIRKGRREEGPVTAKVAEEYLDLYLRKDVAGILALEDPKFLLTYEQLHADPEPVITRLLDFLGVPADDDTIGTLLEAADFRRLSARDKGVEESGSYYRKGVAGDWREKMEPDVARVIVDALADDIARIEDKHGLDLSLYREL